MRSSTILSAYISAEADMRVPNVDSVRVFIRRMRQSKRFNAELLRRLAEVDELRTEVADLRRKCEAVEQMRDEEILTAYGGGWLFYSPYRGEETETTEGDTPWEALNVKEATK